MKKIILILAGIFIFMNHAYSYDKIGKFVKNRAIVQKGNNWGIIDSSYNEYFFGNTMEIHGKVYRIKRMDPQFYFYTSNLVESPVNNLPLAEVEFYEYENIGQIQRSLFHFIRLDGTLLEYKNYGDVNATIFKPFINPINNGDLSDSRYFNIYNNIWTKVASGTGAFDKRSNFLFYLDIDTTDNKVYAYTLFTSDQIDAVGSLPTSSYFLNYDNDYDIKYNYLNYKKVRFPILKLGGDGSSGIWGYSDMEGNKIVDFNFYHAFRYMNDRAVVIKNNGKYSFVNLKGELSDKEFELLGSFWGNGIAPFVNYKYENEELFKKNPRAPNNKIISFGIVDTNGTIVKEFKNTLPIMSHLYKFNTNVYNNDNFWEIINASGFTIDNTKEYKSIYKNKEKKYLYLPHSKEFYPNFISFDDSGYKKEEELENFGAVFHKKLIFEDYFAPACSKRNAITNLDKNSNTFTEKSITLYHRSSIYGGIFNPFDTIWEFEFLKENFKNKSDLSSCLFGYLYDFDKKRFFKINYKGDEIDD